MKKRVYLKRNRCTHDFKNPKKTGWAQYECRLCKQEITLILAVFDKEIRIECEKFHG